MRRPITASEQSFWPARAATGRRLDSRQAFLAGRRFRGAREESISARGHRRGTGVDEPESVLEDRARPVCEALGDATNAFVR